MGTENYISSVTVSQRIDSIKLAQLSNFFLKNNVPITNRGMVVQLAVDLAHKFLEEKGELDTISNEVEAMTSLENLGLSRKPKIRLPQSVERLVTELDETRKEKQNGSKG